MSSEEQIFSPDLPEWVYEIPYDLWPEWVKELNREFVKRVSGNGTAAEDLKGGEG